jgi:transglutaminase-like putative cysteine protease
MRLNRMPCSTMVCVGMIMVLGSQSAAQQSRTWSSADRRFTVEAELVEVGDDVVRLRRPNGHVISVPLDKISDSDREYLRQRHERRAPEPTSTWLPQHPARLVEVTAQLRTTNSSDSDVSKFIFRLTAPPNALEHQRTVFVSSDIRPADRKSHKTGANDYLEFCLPIAAKQVVTNRAKFVVLLIPVDYFRSTRPQGGPNASIREDSTAGKEPQAAYLQPSKYVESDSPEVRRAAGLIFRGRQDGVALARAAYEFPSRTLRFQVQSDMLGAQKSLQAGVGDCSEYACLFAALCRTQSIPARTVGVFNLGTNREITESQPNHHIAEAYLPGRGWIPIDANLGRGRYDGEVGFGRLSNTLVLLNREGAWVWSTWLPPDGYDPSKTKPKVDCDVSWHVSVLKEGQPQDLLTEFRSLGTD